MKLYFFSPLILQKLIWIPTRLALLFFVHLEIKGLENLKNLPKNAIFACNHTSELDPILVPASLPFWSRFSPIFYTSREKGFYKNSGWRSSFYGGYFFKAWGAYPVYVGLKDYEKSMKHQIEIVKNGGSLCAFPEGHITPDGTIQPARGGTAYLAERTGCSIVPVGLFGAYKISLKDFLLRKRKIIVSFGDPIHQEELRREVGKNIQIGMHVYREQAEYVMGKVGEML